MTTNRAIAQEFRKLADAFDAQPDTEMVRPFIYFSCKYEEAAGKAAFLALSRLLPRPLKKKPTDSEFGLEYMTAGVHVHASIERDYLCRIITPAQAAVYECDPILSQEEEETLV